MFPPSMTTAEGSVILSGRMCRSKSIAERATMTAQKYE